MTKRRMVGWQPLIVEHTDAPAQVPSTAVEPAAPAPSAAPQTTQPVVEQPIAAQPAAAAQQTAPAQATGPVQDPDVPRRRMAGWQPLTAANTAAPVAAADPASPPTQTARPTTTSAPEPADGAMTSQTAAPTGRIQDPNVPRRRLAGWQPLTVAHDTPVTSTTAQVSDSGAPAEVSEQPATAATDPAVTEPAVAASQSAPAAPAPVTDDVPRRRMDGWEPLKVGHPATAPVVEETPIPEPMAEPAAAVAEPVAEQPAPKRMGASAAVPAEPQVTMPEVVTPAAKTPAPVAASPEKQGLSKTAKVVLSLLGVAVVAAGLVLLAQWLRTLEPVAEFLATYDGTPTHPDGVEAGIPAWVGWQHFFNFFIIVMVIRSGWLIRKQERPEAYWTPTDGGFYSPSKNNTPAKVSIQQWIHQSFNVLWVANGLLFYIMVFATGHWMRIVPTNWDIFPNLLSAGIQYVSLDWPADNAWIYYNALQIMTYFVTVFIAAPIAVLTGLRLSTWWPQKAEGLNTAFTLPIARTIHFYTMVYFVVFIIVHLFLVFTTGVLRNLNMMFAARNADDWIGIAVFAVSVAVTVGVAWLIKPIFISPIAEKTGTVSTR
ncbi:cytochrome b/b6 domain-containing protein [Enteractinococcus coprophilus]|uniref:Thiosulfate reductase cytochrome b subunit n=1 Tax=Enteractinococcus coprophilus TaxID=1027633 RepID=A0A543ANM4_9MICC|nr:cytochrome b/b6 domain-containing protein [Enteractinococcus coprophilus]TQL74155.1 thiosulfate reductase cytochrome b subunit [Enteractinococcus coprophilus]